MSPRRPLRRTETTAGPADPSGSVADSLLDTLPAWLRALGAGASGAATSLAVIASPVFLVWMTSAYASGSGWQALQVGLDGWLFTQGTPLSIAGRTVTLTPWLLAGVPLLTALWTAQWVLSGIDWRDDGAADDRFIGVRRDVAWSGLWYVIGCLLVALLASLLGRTDWLSTPVPRALLSALVVGALGYLAAVGLDHARAADRPGWSVGALLPWLSETWQERAPLWLRRGLPTVRWGVGLPLLACFLAVIVVLIARWGRVAAFYAQADPGPVGLVVLTVGQILYLPTAAVWGMSWCTGAGFAIGTGQAITWGAANPGVLPLVPFLGALPEPGPLPPLMWLAAALPVGTGGLIAWRAQRSLARLSSWRVRAAAAAVGVLGSGLCWTVLGFMASGALGTRRLARVGVPWTFGPLLTAEMAVGAALVLLVTTLVRRRVGLRSIPPAG